jgi:hypothetical protein
MKKKNTYIYIYELTNAKSTLYVLREGGGWEWESEWTMSGIFIIIIITIIEKQYKIEKKLLNSTRVYEAHTLTHTHSTV